MRALLQPRRPRSVLGSLAGAVEGVVDAGPRQQSNLGVCRVKANGTVHKFGRIALMRLFMG
jgi:hypothetical protein